LEFTIQFYKTLSKHLCHFESLKTII
jgi:hypothetical protein